MPAKLHEKNKRVVDAALEAVGKTRAAGMAVKIDESPESQVIGSVSRETAKDAHFDAPASRGEALIPTLQTDALDPADFAHTTCYDGGYLVAKNAGWRNMRPVLDAGIFTGWLQCYLNCPDCRIFRPSRQGTDAAEGLEYRIAAAAPKASSAKELLDRQNTKRYTRARLRRPSITISARGAACASRCVASSRFPWSPKARVMSDEAFPFRR